MLAGGADIDPAAYGASAAPRDRRHGARARRASRSRSTRAAIERDLPVLGDLPRDAADQRRAAAARCCSTCPSASATTSTGACSAPSTAPTTTSTLTEGSLAARAAGERVHATKSHHHQGVDRLGEGLLVSGVSALDELPEAIELPDRRFVLGVQWHPEADAASPVIGGARAGGACATRAPASAAPALGRVAARPRPSASCIYCRRSAAVDRRSEQPPGGWSSRGSPRRSCASGSSAPPLVDPDRRLRRAGRAVRGGAPLARARRRRVRAADVGLPGRLQVAPRRPATRRRGACTSTIRSSPTACSASASCRRVRLQRALARTGPTAPDWRDARSRARVGALELVHGAARRRSPTSSCAVPRALRARRGDDLRGVRPRRERLLAGADRAALVRGRERSADARATGDAAGAPDDGRVRRGVLERRLGLALQCVRRQSPGCDALAALRHIRDGRAPARRGGPGGGRARLRPTRRRSGSRSSTSASTTSSTCSPARR